VLLTITSTAPGARDLGYLLHKHPDRAQHFDLPVGRAHVFYPEANDYRCTAALLLETDPVGLVRNRRFGSDNFTPSQYVNDRPWAASSMLAVALARVFSSALKGRCEARPELPATALPLVIHIPAVPAADFATFEELFGPVGWAVTARTAPLDPAFPQWGDAPYADLTLRGTTRLSDALRQLYVLLPVLDGAKHYWVGDEEVDKLLRSGEGWLAAHPLREQIANRYLAHQRTLVADATQRLAALDDAAPGPGIRNDDNPGDSDAEHAGAERLGVTDFGGTGSFGIGVLGVPDAETLGAGGSPVSGSPASGPEADGAEADGADDASSSLHRPSLAAERRSAVIDALHAAHATRVVDLGCGEGALLRDLLADSAFTEILGADVSSRELTRAARRLGLERLSDSVRLRIALIQSSVTYVDARLQGFDAVVLVEVVEHLDPDRLPALERSVFGAARPATVIVTTPNADYNPRYPGLAAGAMRHPDHRFEWTRAEFAAWADRVGGEFGYSAAISPIGSVDPGRGAPTQLVVFSRDGAGRATGDDSSGGEPRHTVANRDAGRAVAS
jgi:SAM-dependent methyltransferase